jgi:ferric-dicitrate binding protein FerR (iron transport regulator)
MTIECDTDSGDSPTFEVPLGSEVTLVAKSSIEREFHLHGYDIELTGTEVTFQFTANLPGPHELTEHPDHTVVCTIVS